VSDATSADTSLKPAPKRRRKHGGFARVISKMDGRSKIARALAEVRRELLADIGGPAAVSAQQMILVDRASGLLLHADTWRKWLEEPERDPADPVVDRVCGRYLSCERELRETLKALGLARKKQPALTALDWAKRVAEQPEGDSPEAP
jgi:hypothetical protein